MDAEKDSIGDDYMQNENGNGNGSTGKVGRFVVKDSFSNG